MKVKSVEPFSGETVEMETDEYWTTFERYSADSWLVHMGESIEPVYDCSEHEAAYQAFKATKA